ncbi:unnamed protein product [Rhizopus microsporus]
MNADGSLEDSLDNTEVHISRDDEESSYEDTDIDMIEASTPLKTASSATSSAPLPSANVPVLTLRVSPRSNKDKHRVITITPPFSIGISYKIKPPNLSLIL